MKNKKNATMVQLVASAAILLSVFANNLSASTSEVGILTKTQGCATDGGSCTISIDVNGVPTSVTGKISSPGDYKYCTLASPGTVGCCGDDGKEQNCTYTCSGKWPDGTAWSQVVNFNAPVKNPKIVSC